MNNDDIEVYDPNVVPYDRLDQNIVGLVKVLNEFKDIKTIGCCGGHEDNEACQVPEGTFYVVIDAKITKEARHSLCFVSYALDCWPEGHANVLVGSYKPWIGNPGRSLNYVIDGVGDPEDLAMFLSYAKDKFYRTVTECPTGIKPWGLYATDYEEDEL